jgi:hypothetical protein
MAKEELSTQIEAVTHKHGPWNISDQDNSFEKKNIFRIFKKSHGYRPELSPVLFCS